MVNTDSRVFITLSASLLSDEETGVDGSSLPGSSRSERGSRSSSLAGLGRGAVCSAHRVYRWFDWPALTHTAAERNAERPAAAAQAPPPPAPAVSSSAGAEEKARLAALLVQASRARGLSGVFGLFSSKLVVPFAGVAWGVGKRARKCPAQARGLHCCIKAPRGRGGACGESWVGRVCPAGSAGCGEMGLPLS